MAVEEVWGIEPNYARVLKQYGMTTALQLREADEHWIRRHMGIVGVRLVAELRGCSCLELEACPPPKQGITCSRAFGRSLCTLAEMEEAVSSYVSRAAEKLRGEGLAATVLTVFLMTNAFTNEPQYRNSVTGALPVGTDATSELIRAAFSWTSHHLPRRVSVQESGGHVHRLSSCRRYNPICSTNKIGRGRNA